MVTEVIVAGDITEVWAVTSQGDIIPLNPTASVRTWTCAVGRDGFTAVAVLYIFRGIPRIATMTNASVSNGDVLTITLDILLT